MAGPFDAFDDPTPDEEAWLADRRRRETGTPKGNYGLIHYGIPGQDTSQVKSADDIARLQVTNNSHAFGAYGFQPGTYNQVATQTGDTDLSQESQDRNALWLRRQQGEEPWAASGPGPKIEQRPAQPKTPTDQTAAAAPISYADMANAFGPGEHDHPAHQPLPPGTTTGAIPGSPGNYQDMLKAFGAGDAVTSPETYGVEPAPGVMQQLGHAATYLPAMAWRAVAASIGWRADLLNLVTKGQEAAMRGLGLNPKPAPNIEDSSYIPTPTTQNVASLGGAITPPKLPSEVGDTDTVARYLETFGEPAMMVAGAGIPKAVSEAGATVGSVAKKLIGGAGVGAAVYGLGNEFGQYITGSEGGTPAAQAAGTATSLAAEAVRLALFKGGTLAGQGAPGLFNKYILGKIGPAANLQANLSDPNLALANLEAGPQTATVPGFQTTAAEMSGDAGAQAMFNLHRHNNALAEGRFNDILKSNDQAIENVAQGIVPGQGQPADALTFLQNELHNDREAMEQRVQDAGREAQTRYETVIRDLGVGPDHILAREALGNSTRAALHEADDNLKNYADWRWNNARQAGIMDVPIQDEHAQANLAGPLQALMREAILGGQAEHFPFNAVQGLYKGDPARLFDENGELAKGTGGTITMGPTGEPMVTPAGPSPTLKTNLTIGQVREIQSDLDADIRQERKAVTSPMVQGDPKKLRWQSQVSQVLNNVMDHALENSGSANTATYRLATAATAERYRLMHQGIVGQLLGRNLQGGEASIPAPQTLERLVPGGINGAAATRQLFDVIHGQNQLRQQAEAGLTPGMAPQPVPHPAQTLAQNLENQLRLDFGQTMRDGGWQHGQKWLENNSVALEGFPNLKQEVEGAVNSRQSYQAMQDQQSNFDKQQGHSAASLFLGGDAGKEIDYVARSGKPVEAMNELLDQAAADHTGNAGRGIARMFFDRMRAEAVNPITGEYRPGGVAQFWDQHKDTFGALADRGLIDRQALGQIVNSFKTTDRMLANPDKVLTAGAMSNFSLPALIKRAFQIGGAHLGRHLPAGGIQGPAIGAQMGMQVFDAMFGKLSSAAAKDLQVDMLFNPELMKNMLNPPGATPANKAAFVQKLLTPYVQAAPAIAAMQLNKATGPTTQPDPSSITGSQ